MTIYRGLGGLHLSLRRLYIIVVIDCGVWHFEDNDDKIYRKTTVPESFFNKAWGRQLYLKVTLAQVFSYEFCKISKNTFFQKTPPVAAFGKRKKYWKPLRGAMEELGIKTSTLPDQLHDLLRGHLTEKGPE